MRDVKASIGAVVLAGHIGVTRTALNNYIEKKTTTQDRVRAPIASFYLRVKRGKVRLPEPERNKKKREKKQEKLQRVAETRAGYTPGEVEKKLEETMPPTRGAALEWVERWEALVRAHPEEAPPNAAELLSLLRRIAEGLPPEESTPEE